jgi:hypothetical protein
MVGIAPVDEDVHMREKAAVLIQQFRSQRREFCGECVNQLLHGCAGGKIEFGRFAADYRPQRDEKLCFRGFSVPL